MTDAENSACPLCFEAVPRSFHQDRSRNYQQCPNCHLVFVPQIDWLTHAQEKAEYDLHQNEAEDEGYRRFLARLTEPLCQRLMPEASGLDFGCGPGPALAGLLEESGYRVRLYDPFYRADASVWQHTYDFITATEVVEHFRCPAQEFDRLFDHLRPDGILAIMTKRVIDQQRFATWHYIRDPTHLAFYHDKTFLWLARHYNSTIEWIDQEIVFLKKKGCSPKGPPCRRAVP